MIKDFSNIKETSRFILQRMQVEQATEVKVSQLLYRASLQILNIAEKYHVGNNANDLMFSYYSRREVDAVMESLRRDIYNLEKRAVRLSAEYFEDERAIDIADKYLDSKHWDKTFKMRTRYYTDRFRKDISNIIASGKGLKMSTSQIESAIRTEYRNPYASSVVSKAQRLGKVMIQTPSYGSGISKNSYDQIVKNTRDTIALAWGEVEHTLAGLNGAVGFYVYRGSTFPCTECQSHVGWLHKMSDDAPPFHNHCVCFVKYVFKNKKE